MTGIEPTTDFGAVRRAVPRAVHRMPGTSSAALLSSGRPLTLRGAGHSCDGQTVTNGDLLVTYAPDTPGSEVRDLGGDLVDVPAGMSWYGLEQELNRRGRTAPVLTDYLHMSVGGTLSVGGMGLNSVRHGLQCDQVERILLSDGTGVPRWCSRTAHPELFRFALGGLGQAGLIERAVLRTVPHHRHAHVHRVRHTTVTELAAYAERIADRDDIEHYNAYLSGGDLHTETGWYTDAPRPCRPQDCTIVPDLPFALHERRERWLAAFPGHVRMWTDYVMPAEQFAPMLATVDAHRRRPPLSRTLKAMYVLLVRRPPDATRFAFAPAGPVPVSLGVGMYTLVDRRDPLAVAATRRALRTLLERCRDLGGRPYLYGTNDLDAPLLKDLYGTDLDRLAQLRATHRLEHVNAHVLVGQTSGAFRP
ncbi:FAD-binding protein [Streptomyces sp. NPDC006385]|uniref:FAD-binding protein n=1 Tax=Streptomyces sp. NPDC006385 TaxID=3156761 RepID=UPI0033B97ABF